MAKLFKEKIIKQRLESFEIPELEEKIKIIKNWYESQQNKSLLHKKEEELEGPFGNKFFGEILGFTGFEGNKSYTRKFQPKAPEGGQKADLGLGYFNDESGENLMKVVVELKGAKISLDAPQKGHGGLTPVQQGFKYKPFFKSCDFVIVSNFIETRLFYDNYNDYESWTLSELVDPKDDYYNFRKFYYLLCEENLITRRGESRTKKLLSDIRIEQESITKAFYKEYSELRKELYRDLLRNNADENKKVSKEKAKLLLEKAQKIIDRLIFIHFCEDKDLLPQGKLQENILRAEEIGFTPWEMLRKFFEFVNSGSKNLGIPEGYNGGLFATDNELDSLKVGDDICRKFIDLGRYDFEDDLSVNILGHIFEQSITDIEELKEKIELEESLDAKVSKRKKDGIFYTPEYIVDYIVRNSVEKKIEDWEEELKEKHKFKDDLVDANYTKRAIAVYEELLEKTQNITVLDPACGSGAFLVKVFDFLLEKNKEISGKIRELKGETNLDIFSSETNLKNILQNNIYGVDLNDESVEITRLSLWLKTAHKGKKLVNLDKNIKCGNSLIDDPEVAGNKAFNWETEFPEIFADGGFDVIVGNPPYGAKLPKIDQEFLNTKYIKGGSETAISFIKLSKDILSKNGNLSFIIPKSFSYASNYKSIREYLFDDIFEVVDCKKVWKEVKLEQVIFSVNKNVSISNYETKILKGNNIELLGVIDKKYFHLFGFYLNGVSEKELIIGEKILSQDFFLNDISQNSRGGIFQKFISDSGEIPVLGGADIQRNGVIGVKGYINREYIEGDEKCFISKDSLLVQNIVAHIENPIDHIKITAGIPESDNFCIVDTINQLKFDEKNLNKVFWLLLNSKVINWYCYRFIFGKAIRTMHFDNAVTSRIPIPKNFNKQPFIEKADFMLKNNKTLQEKINKFLKRVQGNFELEKLSKKLQAFYELEFSDFVKELKKTKVILSLKDQDEWEDYFEEYKKEIVELKSKIVECDREIDEMVFDLYGLSEEEREVVLKS